ncbi:SEC-C metal-binding domain-containing protein, partial [Paraburkholderia sp. BR14262]
PVAADAAAAMVGAAMSHTPPVGSEMPKVGRNDPCPCGSGKKYKQCHGKIA